MSDLAALADEYYDLLNRREPFQGSLSGIEWCAELVPDLSPEADERDLKEVRRLATELSDAEQGLAQGDDQDRLTARCLAFQLESLEADIEARWPEFTVDGTFVGPTAILLSTVPKMELATSTAVSHYVERCRRVPGYLAQAAEQLRIGLARGRRPAASGVDSATRQVEAYLATDISADPFVTEPTLGPDGQAHVRDQLAEVVAATIRPAMAAYREALVTEVLSRARPDDEVGLSHLPNGREVYAAALLQHTTTNLTAADIHHLGLDAVRALSAEVAELGERVLGTADPEQVFATLRDRADLRFVSEQEMADYCSATIARAEAVLPRMIGKIPTVPCRLELLSPAESTTGALGYYQPPRLTDLGGGTFWLNASDPTSRPRYEYQALTFHEAVPGHHVQLTLARQLDNLPDFRRDCGITPFDEGWALYAERLADEFGLYSTDLDRLGMLSLALWRAGRLVVDTGIHEFGWSRSRARAFLTEHTGLGETNIANEVDRYIAWPGQATGYCVGYEWITRLRAAAQDRLGTAFDLRAFHDRVLASGPLPLAVLEQEVLR